MLASSPGHPHILSRSRGEKSGEDLGSLLYVTGQKCMVDKSSPQFPARYVAMIYLAFSDFFSTAAR